MSETRGRVAGPPRKANGQRQRHYPGKPVRVGQSPYPSKAPPKDSAQTASILKTRSFRFLVDAVGAENIALALESNMTRVAELMNGERFTPETAFHMETTLGLPHGFFDQAYPVLTPETISRLKSPLEFVRMEDEFDKADEEAEMPVQTPVADVREHSSPEAGLLKEAEMPTTKAEGPNKAGKASPAKTHQRPSGRAPAADARSGRKVQGSRTERPALASEDSAAIEDIRRANLHVLTSRNGSKVKLGAVMGISGSNMAHRLHGKKRMDGAEANRFTERLALPTGWLDTPRSEADIPESVSLLLSPNPRTRASVQQAEPPSSATANDGALLNSTPAEAGASLRHLSAPDDEQSVSMAANLSRGKDPVATRSDDHIGESSAEDNGRALQGMDGEASANQPAENQSLPATGKQQEAGVTPTSAFATSLDSLDGIAPIAEALLKTLAGKARTGRLNELKALEMLQEAILL
ncbi:hypothetical protein [Caballeronia sp. Lep1P3]|uniref:hypothetical protein n=1 Tax=Caballeronia sp. Lep1P3 TaxID=2878150 RepID=UPI001FD22D6B|nr:hypothetical protein [Caballeronia sp. Lep1P3]